MLDHGRNVNSGGELQGGREWSQLCTAATLTRFGAGSGPGTVAGALGPVGAPLSELTLDREHYIPTVFNMPSQGWNCYGVSRHSTEVEWGFPRGLVRPAAHPSSAPARVAGTTRTSPSLEPSGRSRSARGPTTVCDGGAGVLLPAGRWIHPLCRGWRRTASPPAPHPRP